MSEIPYCDKALEVSGGCTKCSLGCQNCWAIKEVWRLAHNPNLGDKWQGLVEKKNGVLNWTGMIKCFEEALDIPLRRKKPTTYFVDSKADLFHKKVSFQYITRLHDRIDVCQQHTFLIFTKRIKRAKEYYLDYLGGRMPENIQLILSISTQAEADEKIPIHLQIPAAVRGLSIEPMLEGIDLVGKDKSRMGKTGYLANYFTPFFCNACGRHLSRPPSVVYQLCGYCGSMSKREGKSIGRVIVGGESGKGARYCPIENIRSVVQQCKAASVPVYVKQIHLDGRAKAIRDINQFPEDLRIRQLPERS